MGQPMYECPFCDTSAWRTRMMLWKHMHECLRRKQEYIPDVNTQGVNVDREAMVVTA